MDAPCPRMACSSCGICWVIAWPMASETDAATGSAIWRNVSKQWSTHSTRTQASSGTAGRENWVCASSHSPASCIASRTAALRLPVREGSDSAAASWRA